MDKPFIFIDAEHCSISANDIEPPEGYEKPVNIETGEQFPFDCIFHKRIHELAQKGIEEFLMEQSMNPGKSNVLWVQDKDFENLPLKIVTQLSYTTHLISEHIDNTDWYEDITDYIEYNVDSFGHPAYGENIYFNVLQFYIKSDEVEIQKNKKQKLIEFIESYYIHKKDKPSESTSKTDLNILYSTYQAWLKIFPFELDIYFGSLKKHFEKKLPFINGQTKENRYSGKCTADLHTKDSLIETLINLTDSLLTQINGLALYENGLITDPNKIKLELVLNNRKLELKQGYKNNSPNEEQRYRKILKKWFNDEKKFFKEITPLLKTGTPELTINIPVLKDKTEDKEKAQNFLIVLSGLWLNKKKIMNDDEYKKVIEGVSHLIDFGEVKPIDRKIKTPATMLFVRRLFWTFHKDLYTTTRIKDCFIEFLHAYFECFKDSEKRTTKEHFSEYKGIFESDYEKIMESIKK
ncbi:MAG: hypothetical protein Q8T08_13180 [Ignavibacteria bacterium]|nr:hypothetical protein [Ignavibacteria bacterium]